MKLQVRHSGPEGDLMCGDVSRSKTLKAAVRLFWDTKPCGVKNTTLEPGSREFYEETEKYRYAEEFHIPEIAQFEHSAGKSLLEIGGGIGTDGRQFARWCRRYVDADLSLNSLELARKGFEWYGLSGQFVEADAEDLPFAEASFDIVYCHGVLHHTPDTQRALREVHRVLRPDGEAVIMLYAHESLGYWGGQLVGRFRLEWARRQMGRKAFNGFVGLPFDYRGWLPNWVVVNNITDGLGNPLSKFFTKKQVMEFFSLYRCVSLQKRYIPRRKMPLIRYLLPRPLAHSLGRFIGAYWYVRALK